MNKLKLSDIFEFLLVGLFICVSGGVLFYIEYGEIFVPIFFLLATAYHFSKNSKLITFNLNKKITKKSFSLTDKKFLIFVSLYFCLNCLITFSNELNRNEIIIFFLFLFGSFFFISNITFLKFKKYFVKWMCVICFLSLIVWGLGYLGVLPYVKKEINNTVYCLFLYHNLGWDYVQNRNSSIFWEPGIYQVMLNISLLLILFSPTKLRQKDWLKVILLLIGLVTTRSTTGYLVTLVIFLVKFIESMKKYKNRGMLLLISAFACVVCVLLVMFIPTIRDKFSMTNYSFNQRFKQNIMSLELIAKKPIFGYGINSKELQSIMLNKYGLTSNSNGLFVLTIYFGLPMILLYFCKFFQKNRLSLLMFLVWLMINITEYFIIFPVAYIFIFNFKREADYNIS